MSFPSFSVHSQRHERSSSTQNQNNFSSHSTLLSNRFTFCFRGLSTLRNLKHEKNINKNGNDSDFERKDKKKAEDDEKLDITLWVPLHLSVKAAADTLLLIHHHFVHQRQRKIFQLNEKRNQVSESSDASSINGKTTAFDYSSHLPPISKLLRSNPKAQALISELFAEAKSDLDLMKTASSALKTLSLFADSTEGNNNDGTDNNSCNYASLLTCSHPNIKLIWRGKLLVGDSSKEEGEHKFEENDDEAPQNKKQNSYHYVRIETMGHFALTMKRLLADDSVQEHDESCKKETKLSSSTNETEKIYIFNASRHRVDNKNNNNNNHTDEIASSSSSMPSSSNSSSPMFNHPLHHQLGNDNNSAVEKAGLYSYRHNGKKRRKHIRDEKRYHETSSSISSLSELLYSYQGSVGDDLDYLAEISNNNNNNDSQGIDVRISPQNTGHHSTTNSSFAATPTSKNSIPHQNNFVVASPKQKEIQENLMSVYRAVTNTTPQLPHLHHHHHPHQNQKNHQRHHSNMSNVSSLCSGVALNRSCNNKDGDANHASDEMLRMNAVLTPVMSFEKTKEYIDDDDDDHERNEFDSDDDDENDSVVARETRMMFEHQRQQQQHIHLNETPAPARVSFAPRQPVEERWLDSEANAIWRQKRKDKNKNQNDVNANEEEEDEEDSLLIEDAESRKKFAWWKKWANVFKRNNVNSNNNNNPANNNANIVNDVASSIIAPPELTLEDDEAAEPEYIIPVGTTFLSIFKQLVLVAFGFMMNLITLVVFLPGLNVPRRAQVLMGTGALLNIIVAWHLVGTVELDVVV